MDQVSAPTSGEKNAVIPTHLAAKETVSAFVADLEEIGFDEEDGPVSGADCVDVINRYINDLRAMATDSADSPGSMTEQSAVHYTGYITVPGSLRVQVDFVANTSASKAELDSAFVAALGQIATLDYLALGDYR